jgi:hypothetical protein
MRGRLEGCWGIEGGRRIDHHGVMGMDRVVLGIP